MSRCRRATTPRRHDVHCPGRSARIAASTPVKVLDEQGIAIANGSLGSGILARSGTTTTCAFPFEIRAVPGSSNSYGVKVGDRPAQTFAGVASATECARRDHHHEMTDRSSPLESSVATSVAGSVIRRCGHRRTDSLSA